MTEPRTPCCNFAPPEEDLPDFIRHLRNAHPEQEDLIQEYIRLHASDLRNKWQQLFGGPLKVDFVCHHPGKMALLRETMESSDIVPMIYGIGEETWGGLRVIIEL